MKYIDLFAGIGGFRLGIERAFNEMEQRGRGQTKGELETASSNTFEQSNKRQLADCVYTNEWDKYAADIYEKRFNTKVDRADITTIDAGSIPDHDLLCGGFPCQAFSVAGKRRGFEDTRGTLFFDIARILKAKRPTYLLLENVKGLLSHDNNRTFQTILWSLDSLGYDLQWQVLNSKNFGVPQNRERVFIIGHLRGTSRPKVFPIQSNNGKNQREHTSNAITANYWKGIDNHGQRTHIQIEQLNQPRHSNDRVYGTDGVSPTLNTAQGGNRQPFVQLTERRTEEAKRLRKLGIVKDTRNLKQLTPREDGLANTVTTGDVKNQSLTNGMQIRRLTPVECERLQGFPDNWTEGISDTQRYKTLGNAVTVNVVEYIIGKMFT